MTSSIDILERSEHNMPHTTKHMDALAHKFLQGRATPEEEQELFEWYNAGQENPMLIDAAFAGNEPQLSQRMLEAIQQKITSPEKQYNIPRWSWIAASAILLLATGTWFWQKNNQPQPFTQTTEQLENDIEPGTSGAILVLADGTELILDSLSNGFIAAQNGTNVTLQNGQLNYTPTGTDNTEIGYNTMKTPKGRIFNVTLPDGTIAWLNAASSLTYPTAFSNNKRKVKVSGEVYFEVAPNKKQPFIVTINDQAEIEVLGTSFNICAYEDESTINTTLLTGSIRTTIASGNSLNNTAILKPGQQARITVAQTNQLAIINHVDLDKTMAWRKGFFNFENASLEEVMRQISRWFDVEIVYEKGIPDIEFGGELSRNVKLSGLITALKAAKVNVRLEEGRKLIVMP